MPRARRYFLPEQPLHIIQRGNDRGAVFFAARDYRLYLDWLLEASRDHGSFVHAYVLMTNHVHLLVTPAAPQSVPRTMQSLGRRYVRHVNDTYRRTGTLWEGRYRAAPIDSDAYFLACCRYIETNPVRAGMAAHPRDHAWSSYRAHAEGALDPLIAGHPLYDALGAGAEERRRAYAALCEEQLDPAFIDDVRAATNGGWALGSARFAQEIAAALGRRVVPRPPGRPAKEETDERQKNLL